MCALVAVVRRPPRSASPRRSRRSVRRPRSARSRRPICSRGRPSGGRSRAARRRRARTCEHRAAFDDHRGPGEDEDLVGPPNVRRRPRSSEQRPHEPVLGPRASSTEPRRSTAQQLMRGVEPQVVAALPFGEGEGVAQPHDTAVGGEGRLQHERAGEIAPLRAVKGRQAGSASGRRRGRGCGRRRPGCRSAAGRASRSSRRCPRGRPSCSRREGRRRQSAVRAPIRIRAGLRHCPEQRYTSRCGRATNRRGDCSAHDQGEAPGRGASARECRRALGRTEVRAGSIANAVLPWRSVLSATRVVVASDLKRRACPLLGGAREGRGCRHAAAGASRPNGIDVLRRGARFRCGEARRAYRRWLTAAGAGQARSRPAGPRTPSRPALRARRS